jgi:transposase
MRLSIEREDYFLFVPVFAYYLENVWMVGNRKLLSELDKSLRDAVVKKIEGLLLDETVEKREIRHKIELEFRGICLKASDITDIQKAMAGVNYLWHEVDGDLKQDVIKIVRELREKQPPATYNEVKELVKQEKGVNIERRHIYDIMKIPKEKEPEIEVRAWNVLGDDEKQTILAMARRLYKEDKARSPSDITDIIKKEKGVTVGANYIGRILKGKS